MSRLIYLYSTKNEKRLLRIANIHFRKGEYIIAKRVMARFFAIAKAKKKRRMIVIGLAVIAKWDFYHKNLKMKLVFYIANQVQNMSRKELLLLIKTVLMSR